LLIAGRVPDEGSGTGSDAKCLVGTHRQIPLRVPGDAAIHTLYVINAFLSKQN
jgi:hypothetical protein